MFLNNSSISSQVESEPDELLWITCSFVCSCSCLTTVLICWWHTKSCVRPSRTGDKKERGLRRASGMCNPMRVGSPYCTFVYRTELYGYSISPGYLSWWESEHVSLEPSASQTSVGLVFIRKSSVNHRDYLCSLHPMTIWMEDIVWGNKETRLN